MSHVPQRTTSYTLIMFILILWFLLVAVGYVS